MKTSKIWIFLFTTLLLINIIGLSWYFLSSRNAEFDEKTRQVEALSKKLRDTESKYLENAKEYKYLLETLLENSKELKGYMTDYKDIEDHIFEEKLRQKVVRLDILIKDLERK